jgi:hypothetical protein
MGIIFALFGGGKKRQGLFHHRGHREKQRELGFNNGKKKKEVGTANERGRKTRGTERPKAKVRRSREKKAKNREGGRNFLRGMTKPE